MNIKVIFENSDKLYDFNVDFSEQVSFSDQQKKFLEFIPQDYETLESRLLHHIVNPETGLYVLSTKELKAFEDKNIVYKMMNCSKEASRVLKIINQSVDEIKSGMSRLSDFSRQSNAASQSVIFSNSNMTVDIKGVAYKLKNFLTVDIFAEEFISYGGVGSIIEFIRLTHGNTRSYAVNGLRSLLEYLNSYEYIRENPSVLYELYYVLNSNENINTVSFTLDVFVNICTYLKNDGVKFLFKAIEEYSSDKETPMFEELVNFLKDSSIDIKSNVMALIHLILEYSPDKYTEAKTLSLLNEVKLDDILADNSDCKYEIFQFHLTNFQIITDKIVKGSNYEIEVYKKKLNDIEKHCQEIEKKVEFVFLNQKFYEEIVEDFIQFKNLSDVCSEHGGYYDPCKEFFI
jgi:hypothetical protein